MTILKTITLELLNSFQYFDWFSNIGKPIRKEIIQPTSLDEALHHIESHEWSNAWNESGNQIRHCIRTQFGEAELKNWKEKAAYLRESYKPIPVPDHVISFSKEFQVDIQSTYRRLGLESEYADSCFPPLSEEMTKMYEKYAKDGTIYQVPRMFAGEIAYWYMMGHFPCGWVGEYPDGKLVVY